MTTEPDPADSEEVTCGVCGRPIASIEHAPFRIEAGDCIDPEKEVRTDGTEYVLSLRLIRHQTT